MHQLYSSMTTIYCDVYVGTTLAAYINTAVGVDI